MFLFQVNVFGQCTTVPIAVDISHSSDTSVSITAARQGNCCLDNNCNTFNIAVNPGTDVINFSTNQTGGASFYTINCGPLIPSGTSACISGLTNIQVSWCKPGKNIVTYTITASRSVKASGDLHLRQNCTGTMSVTGLIPSTITWTSTYPGNAGDYNSFLSQTAGNPTVTVTPGIGAPAYIDYKVSGTKNLNCGDTGTDTVRVYTYPPLVVSINPKTSIICQGNPVTLNAVPTGGYPAYTYLWSTGATTPSISVNTPGTYSVSVNDQTNACGPITQQATVIPMVTPTAAGTTICSGNTATLNATAPNGPYEWYDAPTGGNLLFVGPSYTTPILNTTTTYYLATNYLGCESSRTPVTVTVSGLPPKPIITQ